MIGKLKLGDANGLACIFWVNGMVKGYPDTAISNPCDMAADPADAMQVDFDALAAGKRYRNFCHQPAGGEISDADFALILGIWKPQDCFE